MAQCETNRSSQATQSELYNLYLTMNINNICRVCLEKGPKLTPIFDPVKPPHFSILIMACANVQVSLLQSFEESTVFDFILGI